jgi:hypothetical protein
MANAFILEILLLLTQITDYRCESRAGPTEKKKTETERKSLLTKTYTIDTHTQSRFPYIHIIFAVPSNCVCSHGMGVWVVELITIYKRHTDTHTHSTWAHTVQRHSENDMVIGKSGLSVCVSIVYAVLHCKVARFSFFLDFFILWAGPLSCFPSINSWFFD